MTTQIALLAEIIFQTALKPLLGVIVPANDTNWGNITRFSLVVLVYMLNIGDSFAHGALTTATAWNMLFPSVEMGLGIIGGYHLVTGIASPVSGVVPATPSSGSALPIIIPPNSLLNIAGIAPKQPEIVGSVSPMADVSAQTVVQSQ